MSDFLKSDPAYQEYKAARWRRDLQRAGEIATAGLMTPDPVRRAHWLVAKASLLFDMVDLPDHNQLAWNYLDQALDTAPDHAGLMRFAFVVAVAILFGKGPAQTSVLKRFRRMLPQLVRDPQVQYNIAAVRFGAGKWRQALRWLDRALDGGFVSSGGAAGQAVPLSLRAKLLARLGRITEAEAVIADAWDRFERYGQGRPRHAELTIGQAEVMLAAGHLQAARTVLQTYLDVPGDLRYPTLSVEVNMLAAELALAEDNLDGYRHYCELALATCREENLPRWVHYVRSVMAGAERKYGRQVPVRVLPSEESGEAV